MEEKFERRLSEELAKLRLEISKEISKVREDNRKNQADTILRLLIFWVGHIGAMLGILFAFFD